MAAFDARARQRRLDPLDEGDQRQPDRLAELPGL